MTDKRHNESDEAYAIRQLTYELHWYPRLVELAIGLRRSALVMIAADVAPALPTDIALGRVVSDVRAVIARAETAERERDEARAELARHLTRGHVILLSDEAFANAMDIVGKDIPESACVPSDGGARMTDEVES